MRTLQPGNKIRLCDLVQQHGQEITRTLGTAKRNRQRINMQQTAQNIVDFEEIDQKTSRSICDAVGERLQQNMRPERGLPQPLLQLIEQLRRRDAEVH
jgi:hypothetical protein